MNYIKKIFDKTIEVYAAFQVACFHYLYWASMLVCSCALANFIMTFFVILPFHFIDILFLNSYYDAIIARNFDFFSNLSIAVVIAIALLITPIYSKKYFAKLTEYVNKYDVNKK